MCVFISIDKQIIKFISGYYQFFISFFSILKQVTASTISNHNFIYNTLVINFMYFHILTFPEELGYSIAYFSKGFGR